MKPGKAGDWDATANHGSGRGAAVEAGGWLEVEAVAWARNRWAT